MQTDTAIAQFFKGTFVNSSSVIEQKLRSIKAFIFDWDGVFNNGQKNIDGHSNFSETDSMGINLMRFNHYLVNKQLPIAAIITGENNELAFSFAKRENFNSIYYKVKHKETALLHVCRQYNVEPFEVLFVFDDVPDLSVAKSAGLRFMVQHTGNPLLVEYVKENGLADYITANDGNCNALREISELVMLLTKNFTKAIEHRMNYSEGYQAYISLRNATGTISFTADGNEIIQQ